MNLLGLVPKLTDADKVAIAWAVRNVSGKGGYNRKLRHFPSYSEAARSQELYFLDAEDVLVRIRKTHAADPPYDIDGRRIMSNLAHPKFAAYSEKVPLIKKLENYIKTSKETGG